MVQLLFVDYGNVEDVKVENIRWLSPETAQHPCQAINCGLYGIEPVQVSNVVNIVWSLQNYARGICVITALVLE